MSLATSPGGVCLVWTGMITTTILSTIAKFTSKNVPFDALVRVGEAQFGALRRMEGFIAMAAFASLFYYPSSSSDRSNNKSRFPVGLAVICMIVQDAFIVPWIHRDHEKRLKNDPHDDETVQRPNKVEGHKYQVSLEFIKLAPVSSLEVCENGDLCTTGNTCCKMWTGRYGCVASDMGVRNATCCSDGATGCPVNYECSSDQTCSAGDTEADPLVQTLPRYQLCHVPEHALRRVHGFSLGRGVARLAYYSSHGDIRDDATINRNGIHQILFVIHGANRNADDYFCAASAAALKRGPSVLIIVPRFLTISDGPVFLQEGGIAARWSDVGSGPWRYGASSIYPGDGISSYHAVDQMMAELLDKSKFPQVQRIAIAGHSSGGQLVQRWSLLTTVWDARVRAVVANPSSYAYLTAERLIDGQWRLPSPTICSQYNQWEWGFDAGGELDDAYKVAALDRLDNNMPALTSRFNDRDVVYLSGSLDRCNVSVAGGWCNSHGLETSCMDELEGSNRWERSLHYVESLKRVGVLKHRRIAVSMVGHDHSLMFSSPEGLNALFLSEATLLSRTTA